MGIEKECMLLNLQVSVWKGYRLDKETTRRVIDEANAASDALRVNKHLVPNTALAEIVSATSALRNHFYAKTLPWKDNGDRLLTRKSFMGFIEEHEKLKADFDSAVDQFLRVKYPSAQEQAEFRMGATFNASDYPTEIELRRKFSARLDIDGIARAYDVRLQSDNQAIQDRVTRAMAGLWARLCKPLENFVERMSDDEAVFRNSLVNNLKEVAALIPELNFMEDPQLEAIRQQVEAQLLIWSPDDLRKDKTARAKVAGEAADILETMRGFMIGMGGEDEE